VSKQTRIYSHAYSLYRTKLAILKTMPSFDTSDIDRAICDLQEESLDLIGGIPAKSTKAHCVNYKWSYD